METRGILNWKWEDGPPGAAYGVAWVVEADGTERPINDGEVISLIEAERLADVGDYTLEADDVPLSPD